MIRQVRVSNPIQDQHQNPHEITQMIRTLRPGSPSERPVILHSHQQQQHQSQVSPPELMMRMNRQYGGSPQNSASSLTRSPTGSVGGSPTGYQVYQQNHQFIQKMERSEQSSISSAVGISSRSGSSSNGSFQQNQQQQQQLPIGGQPFMKQKVAQQYSVNMSPPQQHQQQKASNITIAQQLSLQQARVPGTVHTAPPNVSQPHVKTVAPATKQQIILPQQIQQIQQSDKIVSNIGGQVQGLSFEITRLLNLNEKLIQEALGWRQKCEFANVKKMLVEDELDKAKQALSNYSSSFVQGNNKSSSVAVDSQSIRRFNLNSQSNSSNSVQVVDKYCNESQASSHSSSIGEFTHTMNQQYNFQHIVQQIGSLESLTHCVNSMLVSNGPGADPMPPPSDAGENSCDFIVASPEPNSQMAVTTTTGQYSFKKENSLPQQQQSLQTQPTDKYREMVHNLEIKCESLEQELSEQKRVNTQLQSLLDACVKREEMKTQMLAQLQEDNSKLNASVSKQVSELQNGIVNYKNSQKAFYGYFDASQIFYHQQSPQINQNASPLATKITGEDNTSTNQQEYTYQSNRLDKTACQQGENSDTEQENAKQQNRFVQFHGCNSSSSNSIMSSVQNLVDKSKNMCDSVEQQVVSFPCSNSSSVRTIGFTHSQKPSRITNSFESNPMEFQFHLDNSKSNQKPASQPQTKKQLHSDTELNNNNKVRKISLPNKDSTHHHDHIASTLNTMEYHSTTQQVQGLSRPPLVQMSPQILNSIAFSEKHQQSQFQGSPGNWGYEKGKLSSPTSDMNSLVISFNQQALSSIQHASSPFKMGSSGTSDSFRVPSSFDEKFSSIKKADRLLMSPQFQNNNRSSNSSHSNNESFNPNYND